MIFPNVKVQPHWLKTLEEAAEKHLNALKSFTAKGEQ